MRSKFFSRNRRDFLRASTVTLAAGAFSSSLFSATETFATNSSPTPSKPHRIIRANPGEITIAAVGPLTNIATVLKSDPGIAKLIKSFALMGGSLSGGNITPAAEFNFYVDPEAARIVFDSGVPILMVGLDV